MNVPVYKRQEMITVRHVTDRLGISLRAVYMLIETGQLPAFKFSGSLRVHIKALEEYIEKSRYDAGA